MVFLLRGRLDVEGFGRLRGPHILVGGTVGAISMRTDATRRLPGHGRHLAGYLRGVPWLVRLQPLLFSLALKLLLLLAQAERPQCYPGPAFRQILQSLGR